MQEREEALRAREMQLAQQKKAHQMAVSTFKESSESSNLQV